MEVLTLIKELFPKASSSPLSGGDINLVFHIQDKGNSLVIKVNKSDDYPEMFQKEAQGLELLSQGFNVPKVLMVGEKEDLQYLVLENIESGQEDAAFWEGFGRGLANLHAINSSLYGLNKSNYIGSLVQQNNQHETWIEFLIHQRLQPMIEMAVNSGEVNYIEAKLIENYYVRIEEIYPREKPSLVHGDLWNGNYIAGKNGPYMIDPAVYFGHREMDIGMMHLFGGFNSLLFDIYNEVLPLETDWKARISYNQIYPLLVHVNLFGRSYWSQVHNILKQFA
jgi:fructosamine-3-kinase